MLPGSSSPRPPDRGFLARNPCQLVLGGIRALEGNGFKAGDIIGVGINGNDLAIAEFEKEDMTGFVATVLLAAKRHGYETAANMYQWIANGEEPEKLIYTAGVLMDRSNYHAVRKEMGLE